VCGERRALDAAQVRSRINRGRFTGVCRRDRMRSRTPLPREDEPESDGVDWSDTTMVAEGSTGRRRTMVRIHCPACGEVRLVHPTYLRLVILAGVFRPECRAHRARVQATGGSRGEQLRQAAR
jgi:hypothetical protein